MSLQRYWQAGTLVLMAGIFSIGASARGRSAPVYDGTVDFGSQVVYLKDGCLAFDGSISSGSFFDNFVRIDAGSQLEFKKSGAAVTTYPQSLTTTIHIVGGECASTLSKPPAFIFRDDSYALRFAVEWKDGMRLRPAVLSPVTAECAGSSSIPIPRRDFTIPSITCQMTVASQDVPLADHLIVSIFTADGKLLTRLSARP